MADCLVTTLKGIVGDTSLYKLGELRFKVHADSSKVLYIAPKAKTSIVLTIIDGNATFKSGAIQETISDTTTIQVTGDCTISVDNKYNIAEFRAQSGFQVDMDIEQLEYSHDLTKFQNIGYGLAIHGRFSKLPSSLTSLICYGSKDLEIDNINLPNLTTLNLNYGDSYMTAPELIVKLPSITAFYLYGSADAPVVKGNIDGFATLPSNFYSQVKNIRFGNLYLISGDIAAFSRFTNLETLHLSYCQNLKGDLSSLIGFRNCEINISNTAITWSQSTIDTMVANGCTIIK